METKINITSFLEETKKLIKQGCYRKVVLEFQVYPIQQNINLTNEQKYQLHHRHVHALLKIIQEYRYKESSLKNKQKLYHELIPSLNQWVTLKSSYPFSQLQSNLLHEYLLQTGVCLMHDSRTSEQSQQFINFLHKLSKKVMKQNHSSQSQHQNVSLHYQVALNQMKNQRYKGSYAGIQLCYLLISIISTKSFQNVRFIPKNKSHVQIYQIKLVVFSFLMMSFIYRQDCQPPMSLECLHHCNWFVKNTLRNSQLQFFVNKILTKFNKKFLQYFQNRGEINRIMDRALDIQPSSLIDTKIDMNDALNEHLYKKYNYEKSNRLQFYVNNEHQLLDVAVSPKSHKRITSQNSIRLLKSRPTTSSFLKKSIYLQTEPYSIMTSRNDSTMLPYSQSQSNIQLKTPQAKRIDTTPTNQNSQLQFIKKNQIVRQENETELQRILQIMKEEPIFKPKEKEEKKTNKNILDYTIQNLIQLKLQKNLQFEDYSIMNQKMQQEQSKQKQISIKSHFGIKYLNYKRSQCNLNGKQPNSGEMVFMKCRIIDKFDTQTKSHRDKLQLKDHDSIKSAALKTDRSQNISDDGLSAIQNAQRIVLKYSNKLGLQNFKRELKRNQLIDTKVKRASKIVQEIQDPQQLSKLVQEKNATVLRLLVDQHEKESYPIKERKVVQSLHEPQQPNQDLAKSTFMNFVQCNLKKVASERIFGDLAIAQCRVIKSKRIKLSIP